MAILRNKNRDKYTTISNETVRDENLSLKDLGLLVRLLSLPDNWKFNEDGLQTIIKDGKTSIKTAIHSLETNGYLYRERCRDEQGHFKNVEWVISEKPMSEEELKRMIGERKKGGE